MLPRTAQPGLSFFVSAGCSDYEPATPAQRMFVEYALVANPESGLSVYESMKTQGRKGWFVVGGTSASAAMWAARSASGSPARPV